MSLQNLPGFNGDNTLTTRCNTAVMRHQNQACAQLGVQLKHQIHDAIARSVV
jgi:hypothetical protein